MNKTAIRNFAIWAREKLIKDITYKAGMIGITENGIADKLPQSTEDLNFFDIGTKDYTEIKGREISQRNALVSAIKQKEADMQSYKEAFDYVVEEVAYTWFNRLIAIRFMEVNDYLPSGVRVLSSENKAKNEPDFVTAPFDTDLEFTAYEQEEIIRYKEENKLDDLFRMLFIKQCNKLHDILPELFEVTDDYTELLLTISFTDKDGIVYRLVHDIEEADFNVEKEGQVEIIGWMYQYYISQKHDEVIDPLHGKVIKKADIPAATQLFTTDWVVRYMVDNSLGRYWIERNPQSTLAKKLDFFVTPKNGEITYIDEKIYPVDLTFFDPCMGSGHILVYAFDVLMEIYRECGYSDRDAALSIIENNLYGIDIDNRAYQLAYFAIMMKARSYDRRALTRGVIPQIVAITETNGIERFDCEGVTFDLSNNVTGNYLIEVYNNAKETGSLITVEHHDYDGFEEYLDNCEMNGQLTIESSLWLENVLPVMKRLVKQAKIMERKYSVVCTNPPYMNKMSGALKKFVTSEYKPYSGDLFSVFMYRNFDYCTENGYSAFMTPNVWMFIKSYENLRKYIIDNKNIVTLVQMTKGAFFKEATVDICSFVLRNGKSPDKGMYFRLEDFKGDMEVQKERVLDAIADKECGYFYEADESNFEKIPGSPVAYWVSEKVADIFYLEPSLGDIAEPKQGLATTDNNRFVRLWNEVVFDSIGFGCSSEEAKSSDVKWFPLNKGGEYRKWYGNNDYIVNYQKDGKEIKDNVLKKYTYLKTPDFVVKNQLFYFKENGTWSAISSSKISVRYSPKGFIISNAGMAIYTSPKLLKYIIALMNSKCVSENLINVINQTINFNAGDIEKLPVIIDETKENSIVEICEACIYISKKNWDAFETSWDFRRHSLL